YVNTELLIGGELANQLLDRIDAVLSGTPASDPPARAALLSESILDGYASSAVYRKIVATLVARMKEKYSAADTGFISGGERRDWLFSIPLARETNMKHVFLFKNGDVHCDVPFKAGEAGIHISDLINNAASYIDLWLPALARVELTCAGTACVISRGANGVKKLEERGIPILALNSIDLPFFEQSEKSGLIGGEQLEEIRLHFRSPKEWGEKYLFEDPAVFNVARADKKSFERLQSFFEKDPWQLRAKHKAFFEEIDAQIAARLKHQAA
ncbi:MAG: hypothetical protein AB7H77_10535, partial [Bdellovibrionales bacterium]